MTNPNGSLGFDYTTTELVAMIRLRTLSYQSPQSVSDDQIIKLLDYELQDNIVPTIKRLNDEHLVDTVYFNTVSNQAAYPFPRRARNAALRDLVAVLPNINGSTPNFVPVRRVSPEDVSGSFGPGSYYRDLSHYWQGNFVYFYPTPQVVNTFRMSYVRMPNHLVNTSLCGQITAINTMTNTVTAQVPSNWAPGNTVDIIGSEPPFNTNRENVTIVSISTPTIQFDSVTGMCVGDWVCIAGQSPVPQVPDACRNYLIQSTVVRYLETYADGAIGTSQAIAEKNLEDMLTYLTPRTEGETLHVSSGGAGIDDYQQWCRYWYY